MFRISLIAMISLVTVLFFFFIVGAFIRQQDGGMAILAFVLSIGSGFFPGLIATLIFYFVVESIDLTKASAGQKLRIGAAFIIICVSALFLWLLGEWLLSGERTWPELVRRSKEFTPWLLILIPACVLMTILYFSRFLSSAK